jgi:hypothetical protein
MRQWLDRFLEQLGRQIAAYGYWDGFTMIPPTGAPDAESAPAATLTP